MCIEAAPFDHVQCDKINDSCIEGTISYSDVLLNNNIDLSLCMSVTYHDYYSHSIVSML